MKRNIGIVLALAMMALPACSKDKKEGGEKAAPGETSSDSKTVDGKTVDAPKDMVAIANAGASSAEVAALLKHLPADTEVLISMNMAKLTGTPLWKKMGPAALAAAGDGGLAKAQQTCGFDPITSLQSVHMAINSSRDDEPVLIVRGLTREPLIKCVKAIAALEKAEVTIADEGNFTVITGKKEDETQGIAWINDNTLVLVPGKVDKAYLQARLDGKNGLDGNADFVVSSAKANQSAPIWFSGNFGESSKAAKGMASMGGQPKGVFGSLGFDAGIQLAIGVTFADEKTAADTLAKVKPQLGMAKGFLGPAAALVDKVEMATQGADMTVALNLTEAEVEQLTNMASAMMPGM